jgi:integrase
VSDGLIAANPCALKGAGTERSPERKIPLLETVHAIVGRLPERHAGLVLSAALGGLRAGELRGLMRRNVDLVHGYVTAEPEALVFTGDKGGPVTWSHFSKLFRQPSVEVGTPELHFHDLRHLAGTLAAATGASTRELMARLGHSSPRAALIYQHATAERDHEIAGGHRVNSSSLPHHASGTYHLDQTVENDLITVTSTVQAPRR